jgi:organic hydroperoxide reductase OsmC/OhrA
MRSWNRESNWSESMADEHAYRVSAWWTSGRTGLAKCDSAPNVIHFSEAEEFGGLAGRWTPEQLLLSALAACFTTTFEAVARSAKFPYTDLEVEVEGTARKDKLECSFSEIVMRPRLTVQSEGELDEGMGLLRQAKSLCLIARAISIPQTADLKVEVGRIPAGGRVAEAVVKLEV